MADLSPLLHMLGLDADHREPWRNHFVGGDDHHDEPAIAELIALGLVERVARPGFLPDGDRVYRATDAGKAAAVAENWRRYPRPSRAKARYLHWLRLSGVCADLTFGAYLRRRLYADPAWGGCDA